MALETVESLVDALRGRPILRPEQFAELMRDHLPKYGDTQELAKALIRLRWITIYQAKKLIAGRADELVIGPYVVLDKLGEGGMGRVYKATQLSLNRVVALKVVRSSLLKNPTALKRFKREVKAAADLNHPNIVRVFDADEIGDKHFLAMEYIHGGDLAKLVKDRGPLPVEVACSYMRQAALGLQHAHDRKMVHRDVKPSNLLVAADPRSGISTRNVVKILDMGLARVNTDELAGENASTELTRTGTVIGTPDFMSPEQAKNSSLVDHRSDLYSLGCTFYFLLTGDVPFPTGSPLEKLLQHQMDAPKPIQLLSMDIPPEVANIIHCLLAKRPEDRFQSAGAVAHALEPWCSSAGASAIHPALVPKAEAVDPVAETLEGSPTDPFDFGDDDLEPPEPVRGPPPLPRPLKRQSLLPWFIGATALALALLIVGIGVGIVLAARKKGEDSQSVQDSQRAESAKTSPGKIAKNDPPPARDLEIMEKYLPNDATAVVLFDLKNWQASPLGRSLVLNPVAERLADFRKKTGIDLMANAERVVLATVPQEKHGDVIVIQGRSLVNPRLFEGIRALGDVSVKPAWESGPDIYRLGSEKPIFGAAVETSIILSSSRERVRQALEKRDGVTTTKFDDPTIARGIEYAQSRPFVVYATLGLRESWLKLLPMASKVNFAAIGATFEDRGLLFQTIGDEAESGKVVELQRAFGKWMSDLADGSNPPNLVLQRIASVMTEAEAPKNAGFGKNRRVHLQYLIPTKRLEEWLEPFLPQSDE